MIVVLYATGRVTAGENEKDADSGEEIGPTCEIFSKPGFSFSRQTMESAAKLLEALFFVERILLWKQEVRG